MHHSLRLASANLSRYNKSVGHAQRVAAGAIRSRNALVREYRRFILHHFFGGRAPSQSCIQARDDPEALQPVAVDVRTSSNTRWSEE